MSFICNLNGSLKRKESQILQSLKSIIHNEQYKQEIIFYENSYFLSCTRYEKYPVVFFENDEFSIYLEGKIYGKDNSIIFTELNNLAKCIFYGRYDLKEKVAKWLLNTDGDFVIFILSKNLNEIYIINDALGRLPLYYYFSNGELLISREIKFITNLINNIEFDRMAIAQYLLFNYTIGKRTLFENIFYLKPASFININNLEIKMECVHQFNFEEKKYKGLNYKDNINNLVKLFSEACINRTNSIDKNIVSLSGGLDSRSVAAGLHKEKISFCATTFLDFNEIAKLDAKIAEQLATIFNVEFKLFHLGPPKGKDVLKLLKMKNGLNYLGMSFILPFFDSIKETYGEDIIYFTGDGGDRVLPDLRPHIKLKDLDGLTNYIIAENKELSLDNVAAITKIDKNEIISELKEHLATCPEEDLYSKYLHYIINRNINRSFEGEDRNRYYFWSVTPFYSIKFFDYAMNCPDEIKKKHGLYRGFLLALSTQASAIDIANWQRPITSNKLRIIDYIHKFNRLLSKVQRFVKNKLVKNNSNIMNFTLEQIENCGPISKYLSNQDLKKVISNNDEINYIFTITSIIEEFESTRSTIEKYYEKDFT